MTKKGTSQRHKRKSKATPSSLIWAGAGVILLIVLILLGSSLLRGQNAAERQNNSQEHLYGVSGDYYNAGETTWAYPHPDPAQREAGIQWLPALGETSAPVTVMEFSDIFCGHCRTFNLNNLESLLNDYVSTGQVRYVDHYFGFSNTIELGLLPAMMCAAEQGYYFELKHAFFQTIDAGLFDNQRPAWMVDRTARTVGIEMEPFNACLESGRYAQAMDEMVYEDNNGVNATPTFFVNGEQIQGNQPDILRQMIEEALAD